MRFLFLICLLLQISAPAQADELIGQKSFEEIRELISGFGSAKLVREDGEAPFIEGRIKGLIYQAYFMDCTDENDSCETVLFQATWEKGEHSTLERMNDWNTEMAYGKAFLDEDGDPTLEMVVNLLGGVTRDNFDDSVAVWAYIMGEFDSFAFQKSSGSNKETHQPAKRNGVDL